MIGPMTDQTIIIRGTLCEIDECCMCGVALTVPKVIRDNQRTHGGFSHCPNGHRIGWPEGESETSRLRRERDLLKQQQARAEDEARELRASWRKAEEGWAEEARQRRRVEKRVRHGVCPDCNRTFANLARHMASKHSPRCEVVKLKAG